LFGKMRNSISGKMPLLRGGPSRKFSNWFRLCVLPTPLLPTLQTGEPAIKTGAPAQQFEIYSRQLANR
jgi:hypothetical protein